MFILPDPPSSQAKVHELADFAELLSWDKKTVSKREVVAHLSRSGDNDKDVGCNNEEDEYSNTLDEVMNELERRKSACGSGYPFTLEHSGTVLRYKTSSGDHRSDLYLYLLLSTRLNMRDNRNHGGTDGAALLEHIAAGVLKDYLGGNRARAIVFGNAMPGGFQSKVNTLCRDLKEGSGFKNPNNAPVGAVDGKLDAVAWVPFSDGLPSQLLIFGQCKTGTTWGESISQLQPTAFIKKWIRGTVVVDPIRAFCVSEAADRSRWNSVSIDAGLLLDRCRLVDFCENIDQGLMDQINRWTNAAKRIMWQTGPPGKRRRRSQGNARRSISR